MSDSPDWYSNQEHDAAFLGEAVAERKKRRKGGRPGKRRVLTPEMARERLHYDPDTGAFTRRDNGRVVGWLDYKGYRIIDLFKGKYRAARLAWFYMTGQWPTRLIDHINGNRRDDRFSNLREALPFQNSANMKPRTGREGRVGIKKHPPYQRQKRWQASITVQGRKMSLGYFATAEEAGEAYSAASLKYRGEFARLP